ncbi:MAG: hypothetical protein OXE79_03795 [Acidimicrobiaceae bacterium]|nr:hypothetical protein [Acidimicrobiaceae bacterium]MCY4279324.1 hypothetical protein [Acidimicrobiaceae bacterium]MCY4294533.1 hypothetical protein [Acidimicrobiaceae bacterium]
MDEARLLSTVGLRMLRHNPQPERGQKVERARDEAPLIASARPDAAPND